MSQHNVVSHDRLTNSAAECQEKCRLSADCEWFTHFNTECYLLLECGQTEWTTYALYIT